MVHTPRRKIEPLRIGRIDEQARWTIRPARQRNRLPVIGAVLRDVERAVPFVADFSVLASPGNNQVQLTLWRQRQTPRERLTASNPLVLHAPGLAAVGALEHPTAEHAGIHRSRSSGAALIDEHVGDRARREAARRRPRPAAIARDADATAIGVRIRRATSWDAAIVLPLNAPHITPALSG